jgi:hypothetical protein
MHLLLLGEVMLKVFDYVRVLEGTNGGSLGRVIILIGYGCGNDTNSEAYIDMYPGAGSGYEYMTMYNEDSKKVELRTLNRVLVSNLKKVRKPRGKGPWY